VTNFSLYHYPGCFFCRSVRKAIEETGVDVELRDIHQEKKWIDELVAARGRRTVPVLRIEGDDGNVEWMGESRDIIHYLRSLSS